MRAVPPAEAVTGPPSLDPPHPVDDHRIVIAMGATVERQGEPAYGFLASRQQQAIAPEIVEADAFSPDCIEQWRETPQGEKLARE